MANNAIKWEGPWTSRSTVLTTQLNALAANARTVAGTEVANQTNLDQYAQLEVLLAQMSGAPAAGAYVRIYMITSRDGTNYEDGSDSVDPGLHRVVDEIPVRAAVGPQKLASHIFVLHPGKTKFLLTWVPGNAQALAATLNTVTLYTDNDEVQ